jgi:hypothetical protein
MAALNILFKLWLFIEIMAYFVSDLQGGDYV